MAPKKSEKAQDSSPKVEKVTKKSSSDEKKESTAPKKPNKEFYESKINEISGSIQKKKDEITAIVDKIDEKNKGTSKEDSKEAYEANRKGLFDELTAIKEEKTALIEQRKGLFSQEKQEKDKKRDMQKQLNTMSKDKLLCSEEEIDNEIRALEMSISMGTLGDIKAEKKAMQQIAQLKKKKPEAVKHGKMMAKLEAETKATDSPSANTRKSSLEEISAQLDGLTAKQQEISKKIDALKEEKNKRNESIKPLIEVRSKLREEVTGLINEKSKVIEERKQAQSEWNAHEMKLKDARKAKEDAEWFAWKKQQDANRAERQLSAPNPMNEEVITLEQTIDYCNGLLPKTHAAAVKEKDIIHDLPKGTLVMKTKKERSEEMFMDATKGKKGKKGNKLLVHVDDKEHDEAALKKKQSQAIKHTAESLSIFKQLGLPTPMIVSDLPEIIRRLNGKLEDKKEEAKIWEEERKAKVADAKAAQAVADSVVVEE